MTVAEPPDTITGSMTLDIACANCQLPQTELRLELPVRFDVADPHGPDPARAVLVKLRAGDRIEVEAECPRCHQLVRFGEQEISLGPSVSAEQMSVELQAAGWYEGKDGLWRTEAHGGSYKLKNAYRRLTRG